jgi:hypothetical protein
VIPGTSRGPKNLGRSGACPTGLGATSTASPMWCVVITHAITDATMILRTEKRGENARAQASARNWLLGYGKDFRLVSDMALLEPR